MGADGGPYGGDGKGADFPLPQGAAVFNIALEQGIAEAGVAQAQGLGEVDAAAGDLLNQVVVAVFGASGLANHHHNPVNQPQHRLDGEHAPQHRRRLGDAAAPLEVFQGVRHTQQIDVALGLLQLLGDPGSAEPPVRQLQGVLHQNL